MNCPKCNSSNTTIFNEQDRKGYGFCSGIIGYICLGLPGLICGLIGMGKTTNKYAIICADCGSKTVIHD